MSRNAHTDLVRSCLDYLQRKGYFAWDKAKVKGPSMGREGEDE